MQSDEESWGELIVIDPLGLFACISSLWFKWCLQNCYLYFNRILSQWNLYEFFLSWWQQFKTLFYTLDTTPCIFDTFIPSNMVRWSWVILLYFLSQIWNQSLPPREHGSSSGDFFRRFHTSMKFICPWGIPENGRQIRLFQWKWHSPQEQY